MSSLHDMSSLHNMELLKVLKRLSVLLEKLNVLVDDELSKRGIEVKD